ncbi:competence/damage-inducible protein A [Alkalihalophilus pseudofirmus]|uniref:Putative competence-damage inducible protein n=1 Tax=Alkalihalophilus pseudofirmus TaxID=79885 RepID=A0AAJ2KXV0_ALKPS|nr:competence/damage-inducible protein A [Alkalihalophilus pseudofirmus]MDV2885205.1 competence/damage-inducible protein A [Alkalihalophilus pseudofirmus]
MKAEIIAVGSELLLGQIVNSNAAFLSVELAQHGIDVFYHVVVGDNEERLTDVLNQASKRSDLVILTGGLGPTKDDLTKETVAEICGKDLVYHQQSLDAITSFFEKRGQVMTENNKKQALVIEDSHVLVNHNGMAPGMVLETDQCKFVLLPGPPKEMQPMVVSELRPLLEKDNVTQEKITSRVLRFFGIGESKLAAMIDDLLVNQTNPTIAPLASEGEVTLRLTVKHYDPNVSVQLLDQVEKDILSRVGEYFYGYGETTLMEVVSKQLKKHKYYIAAAESLTGGLFSSALTSISGASEIFHGSIISYATKVKENNLGVPNKIIAENGVVSAECAVEMAKAVKLKLQSDIGISFTGVAGPGTQDGKKPGEVYVGICGPNNEMAVHKLKLSGNREAIRQRTINYGCFYLLNELKRWNIE